MEPFTAELFGSSIGGVGPFNGDAIIVGVFLTELEGVAGDGHQNSFLGIENTAGRVDAEALHVGGFDCPSNTTTTGIDDFDVVGVLVIIGSVEDHLVGGLSVDVTGRNGSHDSGAEAKVEARAGERARELSVDE